MILSNNKPSLFYLWLWFQLCFLVTSIGYAKENDPNQINSPSNIIISNNRISMNNQSGIFIQGNKVLVQDNKINLNGNSGIVVNNEAKVLIQKNHILQQEGTGIMVLGQGIGEVSINDNKIYQNKMAGLNFGAKDPVIVARYMKNPLINFPEKKQKENTGGEIHINLFNNRVYNNGDGGLKCLPEYLQHSIHLNLRNNLFFKNKKAGVFIAGNTAAIIRNNSINKNEKAGIAANVANKNAPQLDIYQNIIHANEEAGLDISAAFSGSIGISNNWILNNGGSGIRFEKVPMNIINNTIISNGNRAEGSGIEQLGRNSPFLIVNNILAYNFKTGLSLKKKNNCSYNLLYANDGGGNCCDDCYSSSKLIAGKQYGGGQRNKGDMICDPSFRNPDLFDFQLKEWSPAIDAGLSLPQFQDQQFPPSQGNHRNDLGATGGPLAIPLDPNSAFLF